jgi:hypothetical protein
LLALRRISSPPDTMHGPTFLYILRPSNTQSKNIKLAESTTKNNKESNYKKLIIAPPPAPRLLLPAAAA